MSYCKKCGKSKKEIKKDQKDDKLRFIQQRLEKGFQEAEQKYKQSQNTKDNVEHIAKLQEAYGYLSFAVKQAISAFR